MSPKPSFKVTACALAGALSLLLNQVALGEETEPGPDSPESPTQENPAPAPQATEASHGSEMPAPPAWAQPSNWMSYDEMKTMMSGQGVRLPPMPLPDQEILPPPIQPFMTGPDPEDQKRLFDIFEAMTPQQQEACFAVARWQSSHMPPQIQMPPGYGYQQGTPFPQQGAAFPPAYQTHPIQSFPPAMPHRQ